MSDESELNDLSTAIGITPEWRIDNVKETAMNRFNVPKGRRKHIKRILNEAFKLLKEEGS